MKKFYFAIVAIVAITLSSCQTKTVDTKTVVKTTVKEIGTEGFLIKKVVKGDTVWGYSQETYGTGVDWREIVKENPFLNQPNRVYYDKERAMWIVIIYPGESIRIRGQVVTPTFVSEETSTTTSTETVGVPWWGWLTYIGLGALVVGGIIYLLTRGSMGRNCATTLHIGRGGTLRGAISERNAAGNRELATRFLGTTDGLVGRGEFGNCRIQITPDGGVDLNLHRHEGKTNEQ